MLNEQVVADNHALIARNRELERELAQLKAKLGPCFASRTTATRVPGKSATPRASWRPGRTWGGCTPTSKWGAS